MSDDLQTALTLHRGGRLPEAAEACRRLVEKEAGDASAWHLLGVVVLQLGDPAQAEVSLRRAVDLQPNVAAIQGNLAEALRLLGRYSEAQSTCLEALRLKPDFAEALNTLGLVQAALGDLKAAADSLRSAIGHMPRSSLPYVNLADVLRRQGDLSAAVEHLRRAVELEPTFAAAHSNLGQLFTELGDLERGVACCQRAVALRPDLADAHNNLGNALVKLRRLDDAAASYQEAIRLNPRLKIPRVNLARVQELQRDRSVVRFVGRQRTALLGWELGGGFGHAKKLHDIGVALACRGVRPVFVLKEVEAVAAMFAGGGFSLLRAPRSTRPPIANFRAASFADILAIRGFASPRELQPLVETWESIIDQVRPDLVVADYAPTLQLAAYGWMPCVRVGVGFDCPPHNVAEFPAFDSAAQPMAPQSQLLSVIQQVQARRGRSAPATLPGLFSWGRTVVCTLPELDQYHALRDEPAVGPVAPLPPLTPPPRQPRFYAYLSAKRPASLPLLAELLRAGIPGTAFVRGATARELQAIAVAGLEIQTEVRPLAELLPRASFVVHHGGLTSAEVLAAGRPQLLVPGHAEQQITSEMLARMGVALIFGQSQPAQEGVELANRLLGDGSVTARAQALALGIRARGAWNGLNCAVAACLAALEAFDRSRYEQS